MQVGMQSSGICLERSGQGLQATGATTMAVIELGDIEKITTEHLMTLARCCGGSVDLVLCGGGSPCQDLSVLLADRQGQEGARSRLFYEMPRILSLNGFLHALSSPLLKMFTQ